MIPAVVWHGGAAAVMVVGLLRAIDARI